MPKPVVWHQQTQQQHQTGPNPPVATPPAQTVTIPADPPAAPPAPPAGFISEAEVQARVDAAVAARLAQGDPKLEEVLTQSAEVQRQLAAFNADREAQAKREQDAIAAAAAADEARRVAELSFAERVAEMQTQTTGQLSAIQQELAQEKALRERERQFADLMAYRGRAMQSETAQGILPQLRDLVTGNTIEEIDASISALAAQSASILADVAQGLESTAQAQAAQQQQALIGSRGAGVTAPPVGPSDQNSATQTYSAEQIAAMDMTQYASIRDRLLGATSQSSNRGMFG